MRDSKFIGVIKGLHSGKVFGVLNPDSDDELNNPQLLLLRGDDLEPVHLVRVPRGDYQRALTLEELDELVEKEERAI